MPAKIRFPKGVHSPCEYMIIYPRKIYDQVYDTWKQVWLFPTLYVKYYYTLKNLIYKIVT